MTRPDATALRHELADLLERTGSLKKAEWRKAVEEVPGSSSSVPSSRTPRT
ncbi:hypothetical protein NKH77_20125 [Streptomyces sp. M19]